jgi:parallel beta-helix repeat protein
MGKRWAILGVLVLGLAVAGGITYAPDRAHAAQVSCGDTITTDTTLTKDLVDCPTNGIVIGADNVTLDLNGHTVDGDGTIHNVGGGGHLEDSGVSVFVHDGITVMNGSIRQFGEGLSAFWSRHIRLLGLAMSENQDFGITLAADDRILVRNSSVNRMTDREGAGLLVTEGGLAGAGERSSQHVRIVNSSIRHNAGDGIRSIGSTNSVIEGNLLSDNRATGIDWEGDHNRLMRNRIVRDQTGIIVNGSRNVIARNRVSHAEDDGFEVNDRTTKLSRNRAVRNADLGIEAVRGVNDGGGNIARHNGDPRQCVNVKCH